MRFRNRYTTDATFFPLSHRERIDLNFLCASARRLNARLAIPATSSNFSIRTTAGEFLISRSGTHKRDLTPGHFIRVSAQGSPLHPCSPKPSDETLLHAFLYGAFPHVKAVIHCHAPELEFLRAPHFPMSGHELLKALGCPDHETPLLIDIVPNSQNMEEVVAALRVTWDVAKSHAEDNTLPEVHQRHSLLQGIFVLEKHGIYCAGKTALEAESKLEALLHLLSTQD